MQPYVDLNTTLFRAAIENSYSLTGIFAEDGTVLYVSPAALHLFGYEPEVLMGSPIFSWVHPDDLPGIKQDLERILEVGSGEIAPFRFRNRDGEWRWFESAATVFQQEGGPLIVCTSSHDITERRETEIALRKSEASLRRAQRLAHLGHMERDVLTGEAMWSDETFRIFGFEPQAFVPSPGETRKYLHPNDAEWVLRSAERLFHEAIPFDLEHRIVKAGGETRWVRAQGEPMRDESGQVVRFVCTLQDITERKEAEAAHQYFAAIFQSTDDAIIGISQEGVVTHWNTGAEKLLGYSDAEIVGQPYKLLVPASNHAEFEQLWIEHAALEQGVLIEKPLRHQDGRLLETSMRVVLVREQNGQLLGRAVIIRDITEQKKAQRVQSDLLKRVEQYQQRVDGILDNIPGMVWEAEIDPLTGQQHTTYVNRCVEKMLGYSRETWINEPDLWWKLVHPDDKEDVKVQMEALRHHGHGNIIHFRLITKDERIIWAENHCALILDEQGQMVGVRGATMDVSERMQAQEALRESYNELERRVQERTEELATANLALRIEGVERQITMGALREATIAHQEAKEAAERANHAKSDFLSRMSHELRTPLNAILGFGQMLELRPQNLTQRQIDGVKQILVAGRHLLQLINEVLDISRVEAGLMDFALKPVMLEEVVEEAISLVRPLAEQQRIRLEVNNSLTCREYVQADRQRLLQVLINLLSNAIKYNLRNGTVQLSCLEVEPDLLQIRVQDTGMGIRAEDMQRLFKPFERLGDAQGEIEGTGLGLALSKRLAEAMQGTLRVESTWGQGSVFSVELQRASEPPETFLASQRDSSSILHDVNVKPAMVLAIEDNPANFQLIEAIMEERPHVQLLQAINGNTGILLARRHHPDLILLDLHLPDIPGDEILRELQANIETRNIPVVVVSADATTPRIQKLLSAGVRAYLTKPIDVQQFLNVLDEILRNGSP